MYMKETKNFSDDALGFLCPVGETVIINRTN